MRGARRASLSAALVLAACSHVETLQTSGPALVLEKCGLANVMEPVLCGDLPVPENPAQPAGLRITLNIVVLPATGEKTLPPLYDLEGGPGLPATASANFWATDGAIHRAHRDIVLVDQRGTGASHPLPCNVYTSNPYRAVLDDQDTGDCRDKLSAVADLTQYSTKNAVADLEAARTALGHDKIDLAGLSYGTRVAQEYLRTHPDRVRAVVLMGTVSPQDKLPLSFAKDANEVLGKLEAQCKADKACRRAVPKLAADIESLHGKLAAKGVVKVGLPEGGEALVFEGPFWEAVRAQLASTDQMRKLPWELHEMNAGRTLSLLTQLAPKPDRASMGALLAVSCPEDTQHITDAELAAAAAGVFGNYRARQQVLACKVLGLPAVDTPREFVESAVPVLLLAGDMDAVTPPAQAQTVAAHLPNSRVIVIPNLGHFPAGLENMPCYDRMIADFFESGDAKSVDTSCVATMTAPAFQVK